MRFTYDLETPNGIRVTGEKIDTPEWDMHRYHGAIYQKRNGRWVIDDNHGTRYWHIGIEHRITRKKAASIVGMDIIREFERMARLQAFEQGL